MLKRRLVSLTLSLMMVVCTFAGVTAVGAEENTELGDMAEAAAAMTAGQTYTYNFKSTAAAGATNVTNTDFYSAEKGYGFVGESHALKSNAATAARKVDTARLTQEDGGVTITETAASAAALNGEGYNYNYGGLIFRVDVGAPGVYKLKVETTSGAEDCNVAVTGMEAGRLTSGGTWDNANLVPKTTYAVWDGNVWSYTYAAGFDFIEIEVEPKSNKGGKVGIASLTIEPVGKNAKEGKPTVHILGDSTQKTYTFEENSMSSWGQTLYRMFDLDKVNVVNYSMGGRAMKSNYEEGRFNTVLYNIKEGDYVFIHSAHNDETHNNGVQSAKDKEDRFVRGADKSLYPAWLDMYCAAIEARGGIPVLVSGMPRTSGGVASVSDSKPNGFDPDSPTFMKNKAASDEKAEYIDLFHLAKAELERIGTKETLAIYQSLEAGETAGKTNSGSYANGHPDNKVDGTHYKEAAGKLFSKLIANNIYAQSASGSANIKALAGYLADDVKAAAQSNDWSAVFPEWAKDVTNAKVNGYSEDNSYYRNAIEKMLQLGVMFKNAAGEFEPKSNIKTNDFIAALCSIWDLDTADFAKFYSSGDLNRETMAAIILDAYELKFGKAEDGSWNKPVYMTNYNGTNVSPDDPSYDPNLTGDSSQYYPMVGWGNLTDTDKISKEYQADFYEVYNLGLMRSEKGIERGKMKNGTELEPKKAVTREKAAKELFFLFGLIQNKDTENQRITMPKKYSGTDENPVVYKAVSYTAPEYEFSNVNIASDGKLSVELKYSGTSATGNKLVVDVKNADGSAKETKKFDVTGTGAVQGIDVTLAVGESVNMYVVKSDSDLTKLSAERAAVCTNVVLPPRRHTASTVMGIQNGRLKLTNLDAEAEVAMASDGTASAAAATEWKASKNVSAGETLMEGLTPVNDMVYAAGKSTIDEKTYNGYIKTDPKQNGSFSNGTLTGSALKFVAPDDGVFWVATYNLGDNKRFVVLEEGVAAQEDNVAYSLGIKGNIGISAPVEKGKTYYTAVLGSGSQFIAASFTPGAPSISIDAYNGDTVQIDALPAEGYSTEAITLTASDDSKVDLTKVSDNQYTFVMPDADVEINAAFKEGTAPVAKYTYEITKAECDAGGSLEVELSYLGEEASPKAKLIVASYSENDEKVLLDTVAYDVEGTTIKDFVYNKPENSIVKLYVWDGLDTMVPLSAAKTATLSANPVQSADPNPSQSPSYEKKATVVTASGDTFDFTSIRDAVAKAKEINPQSEAQRVTINVNPGNYEEQVVFDDMKFVTLQQTPNTADGGRVNLSWYFCTGYCTSNTDLNGAYDPTIDWSRDETWNGYKEGDEKFTKYEIGQSLEGITNISYYDINGNVHKDVPVNSQLKNLGGLGWSYDKMAALIIKQSSSDITVKDLNVVNSVPVMKIAAEESGHLTPEAGSTLFDHSALSICSEDTPMVRPADDIYTSSGAVDKEKFKEVVAAGRKFNAGESAWLLRSSIFNERGHALATLGDRIVFENVRARGNQDSIWASDGRVYFKNCTLIGGTDYIYGSAAAVFDSCKLGFAGFTDYSYGNPLGTPNTPASRNYGYLFWNCTIYNECDNGGESNFGGPWGAGGQSTFYNTTIDDAGKIGNSKTNIISKGWGRFGAENGLARLYEYGTKNTSGKTVDLSQRVVNKSIEEGGTGMGTVLDEWQILEFNPRNYFSKESNDSTWADSWDPMNFGETYLKNVDAAIASAAVTVPEGEATEVALPAAPDGIEFKWESASSNAVVTSDGKLQVIRPAAGEDAINTTVALYARDSKTGYGDKKDVNVTINPTTDTTNVFNIPVTVTQSASIGEDNTYTVTITKNGALIKEQQITLAAGQTTAEATIENIPASTSGIDYNVKVVSASGDFTIVEPTDGIKTIKGITGSDVNLTVTANKIVDASVALDISTAASNGNKTYDLIALAKAKDSENASNIENSEVIKVSFDVTVEAKPSKIGYVDFSAGTPEGTNSAKADRYAEIKINPSWVQLDSVDCSQGFSDSSNGDGQYLNITGKFAYPSTHNVTVIIDYKAGTVSVSGNGGTPYTFKNFPKDGARGKLNMGVFPESTSDKYTVSSVRLTYKKLVTGEEQPEVVPEGEGIFEFPGKAPNISGGNSCTDADTYAFVNGADEKAVSLFKDATDATKVKASLTANYLNYVVGTADNGSHPSIKIEKAGKYRVFYLGYNSDDSTKTAKINGKTFTFGAGVDFAESANKILKLYTADIEVPPSAEGSYLSFDCSSPYLPDLYSIIVAGTTDLGLTAAE